MPVDVSVDEGVIARHGDVIDDPHVTVGASPYLDLVLIRVRYQILRIDDVEDLLVIVVEAFENDKVLLRLVDADDVNDLVLVGYLEG